MTVRTMLLTFNAGSSTVKIGVFEVGSGIAVSIGKATIDLRSRPLVFKLSEGPKPFQVELRSSVADDLRDVVDEALLILSDHFPLQQDFIAGHRIVHGGERFVGPVLLDRTVIEEIAALIPLAPLHQPEALRFINALRHLRPTIRQTASFDTAFHATQDDLVRRFALPRALHDEGVKRYGFHGLSYKFVSDELARREPTPYRRSIIANLGSGASLCALEEGISRDCSMGFSTLDGIPMATRPGCLDAGVLLHLMGQRKMPYEKVEDLLYHRSGLLGVSGTSADTRKLLSEGSLEAEQAIDLFALRIAGEVGRMCATLGGLDVLVFTAGIGEHQPEIRARVCARLRWIGLEIDPEANAQNSFSIGLPESRVAIHVIATDEEQVIADEALAVISTD